jgi:hypothetical protein
MDPAVGPSRGAQNDPSFFTGIPKSKNRKCKKTARDQADFRVSYPFIAKKNETTKSTPVASAFKKYSYRGKMWLLNRMREKCAFPIYD